MERADYDYALSLHFMLNGENPITQVAEVDPVPTVVKKDSDDEIYIDEKIAVSQLKKFSFDSVFMLILLTILQVNSQKSNKDEYFVPKLNAWIDLNCASSDWSEVNVKKCNVQFLFDKIKNFYFGPWLKDMQCNVQWDLNAIDDGNNYKFSGPNDGILISISAITRPRVQLVSVLLHTLIHLYLRKVSKESIKLEQHGLQFRQIMKFFNERIDTKITTGHNFLFSEEDARYPEQWWQCTGICVNYFPFFGVIRCSSMPNEAMSFWSSHHDKCGGTFFKIFEARRKQPDQTIDKKYIRNVNYMNPQSASNTNDKERSSSKANLPVRAHIDLTEDTPCEKNLCTVINLDESEFVISDDEEDNEKECVTTQSIATHCTKLLSSCFLCQKIIGESRLASHLDSCTGFQQQVLFDPKSLKF